MSIDLSLPRAFRPLFEPKRYKVYYGGRGAAKSQSYATALLLMAYQRPLRVLCARELQVSIADSVHRLLADQIVALGLHDFYEVQKTTILGANGSEFIFKGLKHNISEIKSLAGVDICWVEEAEKVSSSSWEVLIPTIRKDGSEIWCSFNPKHPTDATYKRFVFKPPAESIVRKVSWRDNPFFPSVLEAERLDMLARDPEAYQHIWEGEFDTRYSGAVYAKWLARLQDAGRITAKVQHDPAYPVYTCWDLGYDDATAIWFYQLAPKEVLFIDYYEHNLEGIGHYVKVLKGEEADGVDAVAQARRKSYRYETHFVPHDAAHKIMAAGGRSIMEQAKALGVVMHMIPATSQQNGIEAVRKVLPSCWFNPEFCADGIDALMYYHFEWDEDLGRFKSQPVHDWSSHSAKAVELCARAWVDRVKSVAQIKEAEVVRKFHRLRREHGLESLDPYQTRPRRKVK